MAKAKYNGRHPRMRAAMVRALPEPAPCSRCGGPMYKSRDAIELDHNEDGTYRGLSHMLCNRRAGGLKAAAIAGRRPRDRKCTICGAPYKASYPNQTCCGDRSCITMLRKLRRL